MAAIPSAPQEAQCGADSGSAEPHPGVSHMIRFLRMFRAFIELEHRVLILESQRDSQRDEIERVRAESIALHLQHTIDLKAATDFVARSRNGFAMYDLAGQLPQAPENMQAISTGPRQASARVKELEQEFFAKYVHGTESAAA